MIKIYNLGDWTYESQYDVGREARTPWWGRIYLDEAVITVRAFSFRAILGNPGVTHCVPTACSGYGMGHAWVTENDFGPVNVTITAATVY